MNASTGSPLGCETCHLPHTAGQYGASFLWAWSTVPAVVMTYETNMNPSGMLLQPQTTGGYTVTRSGNVRSMLCLTCHDGTSASANAITGNVVLQGAPFAIVTTSGGVGSLGSEHPVDAIVPNNADYEQPSAVTSGLSASGDSVSATIGADSLPLWDASFKVECASCHDQHNDYTSNAGTAGGVPFLRLANTNGVALCRECHHQ